ncbi:hypothetical protein GJ629_08595 [Halapricum sp. CBA1109]|uniref:DUF5813 family protein n=1 Tax=Halapricum sp. CBA1109 TaxID=2668068 RepID=UPI0012F87ACE|nr:DUF5813 family protein [Halapricum sp. CBA1109]MUV89944.1 hypothetical protein [Halapricum sp. CBA1109]
MTEQTPTAAREAFETADAIDATGDRYRVTSTPFDGWVEAAEADAEWALQYTVTVEVPTLQSVTEGAVGPAVLDGWRDTLERRLADAPGATRVSVDLDSLDVREVADTVVVEYVFTLGSPDTAAAVAKTFVEYVEGTYVEGIVPGYEYTGVAADLLSNAQSGGAEGERGGTPL